MKGHLSSVAVAELKDSTDHLFGFVNCRHQNLKIAWGEGGGGAQKPG